MAPEAVGINDVDGEKFGCSHLDSAGWDRVDRY